MTSDPLAVLFVLQTQDKGDPGQSGDVGGGGEGGGGEEGEGARPREKTYNLQQTLGNKTAWLSSRL